MFICRKDTTIKQAEFNKSEFILNPDGSVYHLGILPEDLAQKVITVGDPNRVPFVSRQFDQIEVKKTNREFTVHTGSYRGNRITCLSTGMGTANIDIVLNELNMLANVDFKTRTIHTNRQKLTLMRIGTSGSVSKKIVPGDVVVSELAIGLDGLLNWYDYDRNEQENNWENALSELKLPVGPYAISAAQDVLNEIGDSLKRSITFTAPGFYAPQDRYIDTTSFTYFKSLLNVAVNGTSISNIEMETAAIYGLARVFGHDAISINAILADRLSGEFASNPQETVDSAIEYGIDLLCRL